MKSERFQFPDPLGDELLDRAYDLTIKLTKLGPEVCGSFILEGLLNVDRPEEEDPDEEKPDELDLKLLKRLLDRFRQPVEK